MKKTIKHSDIKWCRVKLFNHMGFNYYILSGKAEKFENGLNLNEDHYFSVKFPDGKIKVKRLFRKLVTNEYGKSEEYYIKEEVHNVPVSIDLSWVEVNVKEVRNLFGYNKEAGITITHHKSKYRRM